MASFCVVFIFILGLLGNLGLQVEAKAFFVFGDSLLDNGNNKYMSTSARADVPPYGIDYPTHLPTGRFSNGLNIPDIISEKMGWEPTLPYLNPELRGQKLLVGANFASAGVGVLDDTGIQFGNIIKIFQQLDFFKQYKERINAVIGGKKAHRLVQESLVLIALGGNDFVNNYYYIPNSIRSQQYPIQPYVHYVISEYKKVLKRLYDLGLRRVLVMGTGPLGCLPAERAMHSLNGECAEELQRAASLYNHQLLEMLDELNTEVGSNVFIGADSHRMHLNFISNPEAFGFTTSKIACCGQGPYNGLGNCTPLSNLCPNRDEYVYWDPFHPSERANRFIVNHILEGSESFMHPFNLTTLMALELKD